MSGYGWIITHDHLEDDYVIGDAGVLGPASITLQHESWLQSLMRGDLISPGENVEESEKFRMYDDDGELYYEGIVIGDYEGFEPLDDWGIPNAGCTRIDYYSQSNHKWMTL